MHEITFKMTWRDWQESYRVGLSRLTLPFCFIYGSVVLLIPAGLMMILYSKGYPLPWPPAVPSPHLVFTSTIIPLGIMLGPWLISAIFSGYLLPSRAAQVSSRHVAWKQSWLPIHVRWENITDIVDTGEHFCFCRNSLDALAVPKRAFANQEQAAVFLEQATQYWRDTTGRRRSLSVPDTAGVWPPAPRLSNSAEPGDGREG